MTIVNSISISSFIELINNIQEISFSPSLRIVVVKTEDFNEDINIKIIIFSRTHEGQQNMITNWTLKNNTWNEIAETDAFTTN